MSTEEQAHDISELIEAKHHRAELLFGILAFAVALFLLSQIGNETKWVGGQPLAKQPAFWPIVSIVGMTVFGALELFFSWRRNARAGDGAIMPELMVWIGAAEFVAWFMAYVWLVPLGGYLPVTVLFCLVLTYRLGYRGAKFHVAAALTAVATVVVFKSFLGVKIPGGAVYEYLPAALRNFMVLHL